MKKLICLIVLLQLSVCAFAGQGKLSKELKTSQGRVRVIVQFDTAIGTGHLDLMHAKGGRLHRKLDLIKAATFDVSAEKLAELANDERVLHISVDHALSPTLDNTAAAANAAAAWNLGLTGQNIGIAVIDSGVSSHPDLAYKGSRIVYSENFVPNANDARDAYGHGTHVAGIAAGNGSATSNSSDTRRFRGIAPGASIINLKVLDANGSGSDSSVIAAIERSIALKNVYNIRVINLSLGRPVFESYTEDPLCQAVERAWQAGIVVVVAAGNFGRENTYGENGYGTITAPGNDPYVITVGAMKSMNTPGRNDDLIATYSSKGPTSIDHFVKPDILAPGNGIASLRVPGSSLDANHPDGRIATQTYDTQGSSSASQYYFSLSGTSMATPVVSGAVALLLEQDPTLTPDLIKARLMKTAWKQLPAVSSYYDPATQTTYTTQYDIFTVGAGYLDIAAALINVERPAGTALSPTAVYDPTTGTVQLAGAQSVIWGGSAPWGSSVIWGGSVASGSSVIWGGSTASGSSVIWGGSTSSGSSVIWGGSSPWGSSTNGGFSVIWGGSSPVADANATSGMNVTGGEQ